MKIAWNDLQVSMEEDQKAELLKLATSISKPKPFVKWRALQSTTPTPLEESAVVIDDELDENEDDEWKTSSSVGISEERVKELISDSNRLRSTSAEVVEKKMVAKVEAEIAKAVKKMAADSKRKEKDEREKVEEIVLVEKTAREEEVKRLSDEMKKMKDDIKSEMKRMKEEMKKLKEENGDILRDLQNLNTMYV